LDEWKLSSCRTASRFWNTRRSITNEWLSPRGWRDGGGYFTFNGLMLAEKTLLDEKRLDKVGILDLDMHYGDGTDSIILKLRLTGSIEHYTFGLSAVEHGPARDSIGTERWMTDLPTIVEDFKKKGCQVLFFQAGADPHVDDPLGGVMTSEQMRRRDECVFTLCRDLNRIPASGIHSLVDE
jgi:acetoin utilization deacetylase AcuC-like enzyme